jgi:uncharacterized membrane protein YbhN (UPF0104 family)
VKKSAFQNIAAYAIAATIVYYSARGISWSQVLLAVNHARPWIFVIASLSGFLCWFIGETILYSRLFSYFHGRTEMRELLPTMAAVYFLQIINSYVASGALVLFLHTRKRVPWLVSGCTLMFQGYLDAMLFAALTLIAILFVPSSPIRMGFNYAIGVLVIGSVVASFWLVWGSGLPVGNWLQWLYERPSMLAFRLAGLSEYVKLAAIRLIIVIGAGFVLYAQFVSFHIGVPLMQTLALTPFIVAIGNSPFSPGGIGTTQLVFTLAFTRFGSRADLFALSLAVTAFNLLVRIPMGLAMGAPLANEAIEAESEFATERKVGYL